MPIAVLERVDPFERDMERHDLLKGMKPMSIVGFKELVYGCWNVFWKRCAASRHLVG